MKYFIMLILCALVFVIGDSEARSIPDFSWEIDEKYHRDGHVHFVVQKGSENFLPIGIKGLSNVTVDLHPTINFEQTGKAKLPHGVNIYFEPSRVTVKEDEVQTVNLVINVDENAPANLYDVQIIGMWKGEDNIDDFMGSSIRLHVGRDFGDGKIPVNMLESPLKFWKSVQGDEGVTLNDVPCRNDYVLVVKSSTQTPACVTTETKQKLIERGWTKQDSQKTDASTINPESNQYPTITFPQNATGSSPDSGPIPHVTVVLLGINDTISWINESDRTIIIRAYDNSWNAGEISPHNQIDVKFNHTGQYQYLIDILEDKRRDQGEIIVLGDDIDSIPIEERLKMAQAILGQHFRTLPIVGIGAGNADKVLDVTIHEGELEKFTDAHERYKNIVRQIIPFDVPIRIDFGPYIQLQ